MALADGLGRVGGYFIYPNVDLSEAGLDGQDLRYASLSDAKLDHAHLNGADLTGAILRRASLICAELVKAKVSTKFAEQANFAGADLQGADLTNAIFRNANFNGADLRGADLTGSDLSSASFFRAKVDPHHVPLIEAAQRAQIDSLIITGRTPNPPRRLTIEVRYIGGGGHSMGIPRYHVVDAAASADRMMGPGGHYFESRTIATFDTRVEAEEYIDMVNDDRTPNPGLGARRGPHGYKY